MNLSIVLFYIRKYIIHSGKCSALISSGNFSQILKLLLKKPKFFATDFEFKSNYIFFRFHSFIIF